MVRNMASFSYTYTIKEPCIGLAGVIWQGLGSGERYCNQIIGLPYAVATYLLVQPVPVALSFLQPHFGASMR